MTPTEIMDALCAGPSMTTTPQRCGEGLIRTWATDGAALITWENGFWTPPRQDVLDIGPIIAAALSRPGVEVDLALLTISLAKVTCSDCDGTGRIGDCPECKGVGRCVCSCNHEHDCKDCDGAGIQAGVGDPCKDCGGKGSVDSWPDIEVAPGTIIGGRYLDLFRQLPGCGLIHVDGEQAAWLRWDGGVAVVMPVMRYGR